MNTLQDSFKDYCKLERIDGENQYQTDDFGLQVRLHLFESDTLGRFAFFPSDIVRLLDFPAPRLQLIVVALFG